MPLKRVPGADKTITLERIRLRFLNMLDQKTGTEKRVLRKYILMIYPSVSGLSGFQTNYNKYLIMV